jgi:hypothetical protein
MSATGSSDHWLDRLSARHTRRQALKAAAGAALTLPLLRVPAAKADAPYACQKGCYWTSHRLYDIETSPCFVLANGRFDAGIVLFPFTFGLSFTHMSKRAVNTFLNCVDSAALQMKNNQANCQLPTCGYFNPQGKGGPCEDCTGSCCTYQAVDEGYYCCTIVPDKAPCWCTTGG